MVNRAFRNGAVPNYPASSNDVKNVIPEEGYGPWKGNHHWSYYHDGSVKSGSKINGGNNDNEEGTWYKNWSLTYIMGTSEIDPTMDRFGRGVGMCQNGADNSTASDANPHGFKHFFNGTSPRECCVITKPLGQAYKSWVTYIGNDIFIDSNADVGDGRYDDDEAVQINPMGFTFEYIVEHECGSGLADGYAYLSLTALLILLYNEKSKQYRLAELASPNKEKMTQDPGMQDTKVGTLGGTKFPGYHEKVGGVGSLHSYSYPNPSSRSAAEGGSRAIDPPQPLPPGQETYRIREYIDPVTKKFKQVRTTMVNGAYGMEYYEFSEAVKDKIVKEDWRPIGVFFKWAGYSPDAIYGNSTCKVSLYNANYIAYSPYSWKDGYKFMRINNDRKHQWDPKADFKTQDGHKFQEF